RANGGSHRVSRMRPMSAIRLRLSSWSTSGPAELRCSRRGATCTPSGRMSSGPRLRRSPPLLFRPEGPQVPLSDRSSMRTAQKPGLGFCNHRVLERRERMPLGRNKGGGTGFIGAGGHLRPMAFAPGAPVTLQTLRFPLGGAKNLFFCRRRLSVRTRLLARAGLRRGYRTAGDLDHPQLVGIQLQGGQFAAPDRAGVDRMYAVADEQVQRRPMAADDFQIAL